MVLRPLESIGAINPDLEDEWTLIDEFHYHCGHGNLEEVQEIITCVKNGVLPEDFACELVDGKSPFTLESLLQKDINGNNALHFAAASGNEKLVNFLITELNIPHIPNNLGNTPLHWAVQNECVEVVRVLCNMPSM